MCGIVAIISKNKSYEKLFNQLKKINLHRGPDKITTLFKKNYKILFRRLSIIDLSKNANQPFKNTKKTIELVFNGEIYNYLELKNELVKEGIHFSTKSDTEVIMKSYEFWGTRFIKKLRGMFSIIIFDNSINKIFFFRDPLGQKPLYYSYINKNLIVSSEIKDILFLFKKKKKKIQENKKTVFKYLLRGWCNDDNNTFYKNIFEFPAGAYSYYYKKKLSKPTTYWKLKFQNKKFNKKKFISEFKKNLNIHLRSDVPVAMTLSGGLDSSSLVKTAIKLGKIEKIKTFSLRLQSTKKDESKLVKKFIKINKLKHEFIDVEKFYTKNILKELIKFQDEPITSPSHLNQFILRKEIKKRNFKVLIVGEGGDEVLGGYERNMYSYLIDVFKGKIPKNIKKNIEKYFNVSFKEVTEKLKDIKYKKNKSLNDVESNSAFFFLKNKKYNIPKNLKFYNPALINSKNYFKNSLYNHIFKRDMPYIIRAEDRISMANSIENRNPFIDHQFIQYIFSNSTKYFCTNGIPKFMLRDSLKNDLPKFLIEGKKIGRPINLNFFLMFFYKYEFEKALRRINLQNFDKQQILSEFKNDIKKNNTEHFNFYFKILNYAYWKKMFIS